MAKFWILLLVMALSGCTTVMYPYTVQEDYERASRLHPIDYVGKPFSSYIEDPYNYFIESGGTVPIVRFKF